jgi:hypothetical protein
LELVSVDNNQVPNPDFGRKNIGENILQNIVGNLPDALARLFIITR